MFNTRVQALLPEDVSAPENLRETCDAHSIDRPRHEQSTV